MRFKIDWASLKVGRKFTVFALFYFVFGGNFQSLQGGLYLEGLIFGIGHLHDDVILLLQAASLRVLLSCAYGEFCYLDLTWKKDSSRSSKMTPSSKWPILQHLFKTCSERLRWSVGNKLLPFCSNIFVFDRPDFSLFHHLEFSMQQESLMIQTNLNCCLAQKR